MTLEKLNFNLMFLSVCGVFTSKFSGIPLKSVGMVTEQIYFCPVAFVSRKRDGAKSEKSCSKNRYENHRWDTGQRSNALPCDSNLKPFN